MAKFQKGQRRPANEGRKRGTPNKRTAEILELIWFAGPEATGDPMNGGRGGASGYWTYICREHPVAYLEFLSRTLPRQVQVDAKAETVFRSIAEIDREIASFGFSGSEIGRLLIELNAEAKEAPATNGDAGHLNGAGNTRNEDDRANG